jgi:diaminopimelate decarboxylase
MDDFRYENHDGIAALRCEGVALDEIAERFGTPVFVYSRATLEGHFDRFAQAFGELKPLICFSLKSCGNISIARVLVERGAGLDVVSGGELERAALAGAPMDRVVYAGVGKTDAEIRAALSGRLALLLGARADRGPIGWFNVESEQEFEAISAIARELGVRARAALRVNPDIDPRASGGGTHAYTTTGTKETKFGVDIARAQRFFERYGRDEHVRLDGIHLHLGSPIYAVEPYVEGVRKALALIDDLASRGHSIAALNLGGGFGADYESDRSPPASEYARVLVPMLRERVARGLSIILEPGRTLIANAGVLLTRVTYVKDGAAADDRGAGGPSKTFVICDAGMNVLIRPSLYGAFHFIWPVRTESRFAPPRRSEAIDLAGLVTSDVVGPICETGDFLARGRQLPPVSRGDLLAVFTAGAYGMTMASNYNAQPRPAEVLIHGREAMLIRRRETIADLVAPEQPSREG